jgi:hypothetical protein
MRRQPSTAEGRAVFSVPVSVVRTCRKLDTFPRTAVECLVRDPDWGLFKPPPAQEHQKVVAPVAAVCWYHTNVVDNYDDAQDARFGDLSAYGRLCGHTPGLPGTDQCRTVRGQLLRLG